ncbi:hypothetical protein [Tropicimonas sp. S265A]|uniref:hypothetical protein n=1 Tax=Tropicimonas sp. S265A TaxID=3415134 RepID=UPI003C7A1304
MRPVYSLIVCALALAACDQTALQPGPDPITAAISGKTLVNEDATFTLNPDGTASGTLGTETYEGTWRIARGQFCGAAVKPERFSGLGLCRDIILNDNGTVTLVGGGRRSVFAIR